MEADTEEEAIAMANFIRNHWPRKTGSKKADIAACIEALWNHSAPIERFDTYKNIFKDNDKKYCMGLARFSEEFAILEEKEWNEFIKSRTRCRKNTGPDIRRVDGGYNQPVSTRREAKDGSGIKKRNKNEGGFI